MVNKTENKSTPPVSIRVRNILIKVAPDVCDPSSPLNKDKDKFIPPKCAKYEAAVANELNSIYNYSSDQRITPRGIHSTVHRALKKLVDDKKFFCLSKNYYPDEPKYRRMYYATLIKKYIRFARGDIHKISENTCVITLEKNDNVAINPSTEEIVDLFKDYVGEKYYYDIRLFDNLIIIMLRDNGSADATNISHIEELVKEHYEKQPRIKRRSRM